MVEGLLRGSMVLLALSAVQAVFPGFLEWTAPMTTTPQQKCRGLSKLLFVTSPKAVPLDRHQDKMVTFAAFTWQPRSMTTAQNAWGRLDCIFREYASFTTSQVLDGIDHVDSTKLHVGSFIYSFGECA